MASRRLPQSLERELDAWVVEEILSPEQAGRIRARYKPTPGGGFVGALFAFGAVLIGLGIILAIAANWQGLAGGAKLAVVVAFVAAFNAMGFHFRYGKGGRPGLGDALLLMGAFAYGAGIWLVAQVFHFPLGTPVAMLAWALGVLLAAWALASHPLLVLASALSIAWLVSLERGLFGGGPPETWVLAAWVPVAWVVVSMARRQKCSPALVFTILGWGVWVASILGKSGGEGLSYPVTMAIFGLLLGLTRDRLGVDRAQAAMVGSLGMLFAFFSILPLTFPHSSNWMSGRYAPLYPPLLILLLLGAGYFAAKRAFSGSGQGEGRALLALVFAHGLIPLFNLSYPSAIFPAATLVLFGSMLVLAYSAHSHREWGPFRFALWLLGILLAIRYFDIFSNILPQALFFVLGGVILVLGGVALERSAKRLFAAGGRE
ncbi:DUF2157 domain-containing protein [bacterium]|nr:DUF2157 domain-containing protein [bacterium]